MTNAWTIELSIIDPYSSKDKAGAKGDGNPLGMVDTIWRINKKYATEKIFIAKKKCKQWETQEEEKVNSGRPKREKKWKTYCYVVFFVHVQHSFQSNKKSNWDDWSWNWNLWNNVISWRVNNNNNYNNNLKSQYLFEILLIGHFDKEQNNQWSYSKGEWNPVCVIYLCDNIIPRIEKALAWNFQLQKILHLEQKNETG